MKRFAKVALVSVTLLSMGTLTACQSMMQHHDPAGMQAGSEEPHHHHHWQHHMSEQEMAKHQAALEQFKQACNNQTVGAKVQVKLEDKTITGTCELRFKPDMNKDHPMYPANMNKDHSMYPANMPMSAPATK
ncbi:hypothetical protein P255_02925 [Acinetobacter brisouii CIP 110357]|uniref:Uncharacterized protein n=1 Tax=Acinetobacter brisouii CIP 110357 TaxID=1341683 RepID=V2UGG1_9GAMM|nr:hypothetical protein [Acinetobacter brisouii]ENV46899.1 hypothetical protein F954_01693 [Acinetobacter brisouii ANC 4119]ESK47651.1 hypothetical protein P255_02925 [Acinetobacter brisouii CIP 110357]